MLELERKWTVSKDIISKYRFKLKYKIKQAYIAISDDIEVRVRSKNNIDNDKDKKYYITRKEGKGNNIRKETTIPISKESGEILFDNCGTYIYKNRYELENPKELLELDEIKEVIIDTYIKPEVNHNKIELEFTDKESMNNFIPPIWFGEELEFGDKDLYLSMKKGENINV